MLLYYKITQYKDFGCKRDFFNGKFGAACRLTFSVGFRNIYILRCFHLFPPELMKFLPPFEDSNEPVT